MNNLPDEYIAVLALLKFEDVPPMPVVGFMAKTVDDQTPYFHVPAGRIGYDPALIIKWRYLKDIAPDFTL